MSDAADVHAATDDSDVGRRELRSKVTALIWEECRVGGVVAVVTLVTGFLVLVLSTLNMGIAWMRKDPLDFLLLALGAPLALCFLLILNVDYSGHLSGGFSKRILRLPVPTYVTVAVSLCARTAFVFVVTLLSVLASYGWLDVAVGLNAVWMITCLYLLCQFLDWLRAPVSGLSSVLLTALLTLVSAAFISSEFNPMEIAEAILREPVFETSTGLLIVLPALAVTYVLAVPVVHAGRIGRRVGIPEIWDWPGRLTLSGSGRRRPFHTATTAQIWYELRRRGWIMPTLTIGLWLFMHFVSWAYGQANDEDEIALRQLQSFLPLLALLVGAVAHGAGAGLPGLRRLSAKSEYPLQRPVATNLFARSRTLANLILLLPLLLFAMLTHFAISAGSVLPMVIGEAYDLGLASVHEIIGIFLPRTLALGLVAWFLMAAASRLIWVVAASTFAFMIVAEIVADEAWQYDFGTSVLPISIALIVLTAVVLRHLIQTQLLPRGTSHLLVTAWLAVAWILYGAAHGTVTEVADVWIHYGYAACVSLGIASLLPLPYLAILLDARRNRHAGRPIYDLGSAPAQSRLRIALPLALFAALWLGWPAEPSFKDVWRARGLPTDLEEFDAWYPAVPPEENVALRYVELGEHTLQKEMALNQELVERYDLPGTFIEPWFEQVVIVGSADVEYGVPLPPVVEHRTEEYWARVTATTAPILVETGELGGQPSRYPIDLTDGYVVELPHLARLRFLARQLAVDALHWSIADDSKQATESLLAMLPIAHSLKDEPLLISQLVRSAILGMALGYTEDLMARVEFSDADLVRLQGDFATAVPPVDSSEGSQLMLNRAMVGEVLMTIEGAIQLNAMDSRPPGRTSILAPFTSFVRTLPAERITRAWWHERQEEAVRLPWPEFYAREEQWDEMESKFYTFAPIFVMTSSALNRSYEAEFRIRTQLDVARTAIAVERYRRDHGALPDRLDNLVPRYLESVPRDFYSPTAAQLRYRTYEDGSYVVYSVSRDMEDDGGIVDPDVSPYHEGDITFRGPPPGAL